MESSYLFILQLAILMLAAHVAGTISEKFKQPAVMGQILVGLVFGMGLMEKTELINEFAQIGVVFLMFIAGLETDVKELVASLKSSSMIALGGVIVPAALIFISIMMIYPDHGVPVALFLAIVSTATSVSISVQTLREINQLRTKQGIMILGAAIIDDVVGIILLTLLVGIVKPGVSSSVGIVALKIVGFFLILYVVGFVVIKVMKKLDVSMDLDDKVITWAVILCFVLAFISEEFGVAAITGAYFAGVIISMTTHKHRVSHEISKISGLVFMPIFFVSIGMDIDLVAAFSAIGVGSLLIIFGILGKIIGCGVGARITGFSAVHSLQIGVGMVPRAEVAIIVANLGLQMGILSDKDMAAAVLMVLVTTLITPSMLKWTFQREKKDIKTV